MAWLQTGPGRVVEDPWHVGVAATLADPRPVMLDMPNLAVDA